MFLFIRASQLLHECSQRLDFQIEFFYVVRVSLDLRTNSVYRFRLLFSEDQIIVWQCFSRHLLVPARVLASDQDLKLT